MLSEVFTLQIVKYNELWVHIVLIHEVSPKYSVHQIKKKMQNYLMVLIKIHTIE